jgi:hypothetical protein
MGYGTYSTAAYTATTKAKIDSGTNFAYDRTVRSTGNYKAHEILDPTKKNAAGLNIRESRDRGDEESLPIIVGFDVTGSNISTARIVQKKLANLFGLLIRKGYTGEQAPQIGFSAYGDANTDRVPLQVSQLEADNKSDDALDKLFLEGNGGGNGAETASLLWYYINNHVVTDAWEKRGKKGYFFLIADEISAGLRPAQVQQFIGADEAPAQDQLTVKHLAEELSKKWEVFVLLVDNSTARLQGSQKFYSDLFGTDRVIPLESDETVSEMIGAVIGRFENDDLDDDELVEDLVSEGATKAVAQATASAVSRISGNPTGSVARTNVRVNGIDPNVFFV